MPQGINTYGGGGAPTTTQTQINTGPAGPSGFYDASFMNFLRRRKPAPGMAEGPTDRVPTPNDQALESAKNAALFAQYRAESEPPPLTYTAGGFNIGPPHLEMDINHMSGAQRAKYLPQNSGMVPSEGHGRSAIEEDAGVSEQDKNAMEGQMISSRISNAGDARRQQYIKDRQLQSYYGTGDDDQRDNQHGNRRG